MRLRQVKGSTVQITRELTKKVNASYTLDAKVLDNAENT